MFRLVARETGLPSAAPLLKSYAKVEPVTIAELNSFITTDPPQVMSYVYAVSSLVCLCIKIVF